MDPVVGDWVQKGGAFGVIAVLIYFYRRDWKTLTEYWQQQNTLLMEIVRTNTVELGRVHESLKLSRVEAANDAEAIRTRLHEWGSIFTSIQGDMRLLARGKKEPGQ